MNGENKNQTDTKVSAYIAKLCAVPRNYLRLGDYIKYKTKSGAEDIAQLNSKHALEFRSVITDKGEINKKDIITILEPQGT